MWYNNFRRAPLHRTQEGGWKRMETYFLEMVNSILAGVIAYYLCKWLDHRFKWARQAA